MGQEIENTVGVHDFVAYYREKRPYKFSDSEIIYELPLTKELFENQLSMLSTQKKQNDFEAFVLGCAERLISPNIKPQTGPDGGGDGKVDAETYEVSSDISDKWYVAEGGASGEEKWAFAISCKKQWRQKVASDVEKMVSANRGYTRALFFSNQLIKSSKRMEVEEELSEKYGIKVSIFDGAWCSRAVFFHGCMDVALGCLHFSEEYRRKHERIGPLDKRRKERLDEIETNILRRVVGLDTGYIEELQEACILSRELERPRVETEGRFDRALRECEKYGSVQQQFNIIYDHAWTSVFWFEDIEAMYLDFKRLREFVEKDCTVARVEKMITLLTVLNNAAGVGLFETNKIQIEDLYVRELRDALEKRSDKPSCLLYVRLYIVYQKLISHLINKKLIDEDIDELRPLLLEVPFHLEINFDAQYQIITDLNKAIDDNPKYEKLVDELTSVLKERHAEQEAARIEMDRALILMDKGRLKQAIRHFSFCIRPFEKEECMGELIQVSGMMGLALCELGLPYSAEAYLVKSVALLLKTFYVSGNVPHFLLTALQKLCEIELILGRFVMYLNWYELMMVVARNGQFSEDRHFKEGNILHDSAWACRFAAADLANPQMSVLPAILERMELFYTSEYLKYALGYVDEVDVELRNVFAEKGWQNKMLTQPIFKQFFFDLNIATNGPGELKTTVNNCTLHIEYDNNCQTQIVAEIFLGAIEAMLATIEGLEILTITKDVYIKVTETERKSELIQLEKSSEYQLNIAVDYTEKELWECVSVFIASFFTRNTLPVEDLAMMLQRKQEEERLMDRVSDLVNVKHSISNVLGNTFKNKIEDWQKRDG